MAPPQGKLSILRFVSFRFHYGYEIHNHKYSTVRCVYVKSVPTPRAASKTIGELGIKFQNSGRICYAK
jgi:hypothetical protein